MAKAKTTPQTTAKQIHLTPLAKTLQKSLERTAAEIQATYHAIAADIETKYGRETLLSATTAVDEFDWGLLCGRLSALAWLGGGDWETAPTPPEGVARTTAEIGAAYDEMWDAVWWHRKRTLIEEIQRGGRPAHWTKGTDAELIAEIQGYAEPVEQKYGREKLMAYAVDDFEWGVLNGRLSALAWFGGTEWEHSLDT